MKNIFFFINVGFSKRDYLRFNIPQLSKFYNVYVIDLTNFINKNYSKNITEKTNIYQNYIKLKSFDQLIKILNTIKCDYAFDYLTDNSLVNYKVRKLLKKLKIKLVIFKIGLVPEVNRKTSEKVFRYFRLILKPITFLKKIYLILENKYFAFLNKSIIYDFACTSGQKADIDPKVVKSRKKIFIHSLDYEIYLNLKTKKTLKKKYMVFVDQYLPFHPSQYFRREKPKATEKKYFPALNRFFYILEKSYNTRVIIAAHPRANLNKYKKFFGNRKIIKHKTIQLVKNSQAVLTHTSTAISYAVIFNKPIIFLTSDEIIKSYDDYRVHSNSRLLDSFLINIDKKKELNQFKKKTKITKVNKNKYKLYIDNYIKHPLSKKNSLIEAIKKNLL